MDINNCKKKLRYNYETFERLSSEFIKATKELHDIKRNNKGKNNKEVTVIDDLSESETIYVVLDENISDYYTFLIHRIFCENGKLIINCGLGINFAYEKGKFFSYYNEPVYLYYNEKFAKEKVKTNCYEKTLRELERIILEIIELERIYQNG